VFASGLAAFSGLTQSDEAAAAAKSPGISANIGVYLKLPARVDPALVRAQLPLVSQQFQKSIGAGSHDLDLN